jgi:hypothetical protein
MLNFVTIEHNHDRGVVIMLIKLLRKGNDMFTALNAVFSEKPAISALAIIFIVASSQYAGYKKNEQTQSEMHQITTKVDQLAESNESIKLSLYKMEYMPSYEIIKLGLAGLSHEESIGKIKFWGNEGWVAKIANLTTLCEEPERKLLIKLAGNPARAGDYCRAMH